LATSKFGSGQEYDPDARLYVTACMACHYNAGPTPLPARPELALDSALTLPEPTNFIHVVLNGIGIEEGGPGLVMPGYAEALTDADIARLAVFLRRTRTGASPWTDVERKVAALRRPQAASG
jgi:mono/diheme cytochrome c family protein